MQIPGLADPFSLSSPPDFLKAATETLPPGLKQRNTALDWLFYDVGQLTETEIKMLIAETHREGTIIVVWPSGAGRDPGLQKYNDYRSLRAAPGRLLQRFAIAGVGSSDLGAVAFARTVADHFDEPVGAIVAGYGVADLMGEALGGWFTLGGANRLLHWFRRRDDRPETMAAELAGETSGPEAISTSDRLTGLTDSQTLLRLLLDEDREILSLAGHSKGCLSIAYALEALALSGIAPAISKARAARVTTAGAVVELPTGFDNVGQYLGTIDWFGGLNSRIGLDFNPWPGAWHHLNTAIPAHMDFAAVLQREPGAS